MLGLLYGRYLHQHEQAEQYLTQAVKILHDPSKQKMAQETLAAVRRDRRR